MGEAINAFFWIIGFLVVMGVLMTIFFASVVSGEMVELLDAKTKREQDRDFHSDG